MSGELNLSKAQQQEYYDRLQQVRTEGTYEKWITFFLEGVVAVCKMVIDELFAKLV
jgi:Fic family protein